MTMNLKALKTRLPSSIICYSRVSSAKGVGRDRTNLYDIIVKMVLLVTY